MIIHVNAEKEVQDAYIRNFVVGNILLQHAVAVISPVTKRETQWLQQALVSAHLKSRRDDADTVVQWLPFWVSDETSGGDCSKQTRRRNEAKRRG